MSKVTNNTYTPPQVHAPPLEGGWLLSEAELNTAIKELDRFLVEGPKHLVPPGLVGTGKLFPYIGWFWRSVEWDQGCDKGYSLYIPSNSAPGYDPDMLGDEPDFIGFMENNKWEYATRRCTADAFRLIRRTFEAAVLDPTLENLTIAFQVVQDAVQVKEKEQ